MRFGPYGPEEIKAIVPKLEELGIAFQLDQDMGELKRQEARWNQTYHRSGPSYSPSYVTLEIEDQEFERRRAALEGLGLIVATEEPDFSREDYLCPRCRKIFEEPGFCPTHSVALLTLREFADRKAAMNDRRIAIAASLIVGLFVAAYVFAKFIYRPIGP